MRLYLIRHGDPDYANDTLTADGRLEAEALADRLAPLGLNYMYSSPLGRALATMKATADRLHAEHRVLEWTSEITGMYMTLDGYGTFAPFNTPGELIMEREPVQGQGGSCWLGEPYFADERLPVKLAEIERGSDLLLKQHGYERVGGRYRCVRPNDDKIAVFCHGGLGLTWLAHLLQLPVPLVWSSFWLAPTSVTTVFMDQRTPEWAVPRCIELGDTSHLHAAGLPVKLRGIWNERLDGQLAGGAQG